jgi:hypothetical protein
MGGLEHPLQAAGGMRAGLKPAPTQVHIDGASPCRERTALLSLSLNLSLNLNLPHPYLLGYDPVL